MKGQKVEVGSVDNLATLHTLDEHTLLEEVRARYHNQIIYTYIADILLAVNPYKRILIYGTDYLQRYADIKVRADLPPHIYAISDQAYQNMRFSGHNQCCVVSGESGSGKTESTKLMVEHIAHLCRNENGHLQKRIIQVNPLLEAFGNAQTVMNHNSSRFGKYIELCFAHDGRILGAHISEYLLEKSRVVTQGTGEKNFHVFYYIFAGLTSEQLKINLLNMPEDHRILRMSSGQPIFSNEAEFNHYRQQWEKLRDIMDVVGFLPEEINMILALLASILHITDIEFAEDYETDGIYIEHEDVMEIAAELLAIQPEELAACLISNVTFLRGERIVSLKNMEQGSDGRDALSKALYGRLFGWIVRQINMMLQPDRRLAEPGPTIGILDIAGFENFDVNSFEQLCINAANEQLQFYFNQHIFQWELDEYKKEGVKGKDIKFVDNRPVLDLMLQSPMGLFSLLDEESRFPQSTDQTLLDKLDKNLSKKGMFKRPKSQQFKFNISHYAGAVTYTVNGFLAKNRDTLSLNLLECMKNSESQIVCDLFTAPISDTGALQLNPEGPKRSRKSLLLCKAKDWSYTQTRSLSKHAGKKLKEQKAKSQVPMYEATIKSTLGGHFKNSLTDLMGKLLDCEPHFVRCIKPNLQKKPNMFEQKQVADQLRYTGVLETVRIRRAGYATRMPFHIFMDRYKILGFKLTQQVDPTPQNCSKLLKKVGLKDWEIGKTKVFLKYWHMEDLALRLNKVGWNIVHCQRYVRGYLVRKKYCSMIELARQDKAAVRGFCVYLANTSEDLLHNLIKQQDHDAERKRRDWEERNLAKYARIDEIHQTLEAKQRQERERIAKRAVSPGRNIPPRPHREPSRLDKPLPPMPRNRSPSPAPVKQRKHLQPTPLLLGNPVYGSHDQIFRSAQDIYGTSSDFKQPIRRTSSDNKAETDSLRSPVSKLRHNFEPSENGHLTRPSPLISAQGSSREFFDKIITESLKRLPDIEKDIWAKIYYNEKGQVINKLYLREKEIIIDDSEQEYDGCIIGLGSMDNPYRDKAIDDVRKQIGKGVKLMNDEEGNIYASKITKGEIKMKGANDPSQNCMSKEVQDHQGKLTDKPMKIFDMKEFKSHIAEELKKDTIDTARLHRLTMVSFSFIRNTFQDLETPSWITVINFTALNMLGQDQKTKLSKHKKELINRGSRLMQLPPSGRRSENCWYYPHQSLAHKVGVLREVQSMARLNLGDAEEQQLRRNWEKLDLRNPYGSTPELAINGRLSRADITGRSENTLPSSGRHDSSYADHDIYSKGAGAKKKWAKFNQRNS